MSLKLHIPPVTRGFGFNLDFSKEALASSSTGDEHDREAYDIHPFFKMPICKIQGCSFPPFFVRSRVRKMQQEWVTRSDDIILIGATLRGQFPRFVEALLQERTFDFAAKENALPHWVDAAVSRRGWGYLEALERAPRPRVLTTQTPPWILPCRNSSLPRKPFPEGWTASALMKAAANHTAGRHAGMKSAEMPKVAVIVVDPRVAIMKEMQLAYLMVTGLVPDDRCKCTFEHLLRGLISQQGDLTPGVACGSVSLKTAAWAEAEALDPEHVRLFFCDDFFAEPNIAMRGLFQFLGRSSAAIMDRVEKEFSLSLFDLTLDSDHGPKEVQVGSKTPFGDLRDLKSFPQMVASFERLLAAASAEVRHMWDSFLSVWLHSSNARLACLAQAALKRQAWAPPGWWAAHCARLCRPCLFFPRGTCREGDLCAHCHGPDHHKPKRPNRAKRSRRKGETVRNDRTPSPVPCQERGGDAIDAMRIVKAQAEAVDSLEPATANAVVGANFVPKQPYLFTAAPMQVVTVWASTL